MAASATLEQLLQYHRLLLAEQRRRNPVSAFDRDAAIEQLLAKLDEMGERLRANPNFVEPDPEDSRRMLDEWFRSYASRAGR
jgi:hypothetical protein